MLLLMRLFMSSLTGLLPMSSVEIQAFVVFQDAIFTRRVHLGDSLSLFGIFAMFWLLESSAALRLPHEDAFSILSRLCALLCSKWAWNALKYLRESDIRR